MEVKPEWELVGFLYGVKWMWEKEERQIDINGGGFGPFTFLGQWFCDKPWKEMQIQMDFALMEKKSKGLGWNWMVDLRWRQAHVRFIEKRQQFGHLILGHLAFYPTFGNHYLIVYLNLKKSQNPNGFDLRKSSGFIRISPFWILLTPPTAPLFFFFFGCFYLSLLLVIILLPEFTPYYFMCASCFLKGKIALYIYI